MLNGKDRKGGGNCGRFERFLRLKLSVIVRRRDVLLEIREGLWV